MFGEAVSNGEGDTVFHQSPAPAQGQAQLQEEELVENEPAVGRRFSLIQEGDIFICVGIMGPPEGVGQRDEILAPADLLRDAAEFLGGEVIDGVFHDPADGALPLVEPFGLGINGNDAAEVERFILTRRRGGILGRGFGILFAQDLQLRMVDFLLELVELHLSEKDQPHPLIELPLHEPGVEVEPFGDQGAGLVAHGQLKRPSPPVGGHLRMEDGSHDGLHLAHGKLGDGLYLPAVLIEAGEEVKGVFYGNEVFFLQDLRQTRAHPFDELNGGLQVFSELTEFRLRGPGLAGQGGFILALQVIEYFQDLLDPGLFGGQVHSVEPLNQHPQSLE